MPDDKQQRLLKEAWLKMNENDSDDEGGNAPTEADMEVILDKIRTEENLTDEMLHKVFEELGLNPHKAETEIYKELKKRL